MLAPLLTMKLYLIIFIHIYLYLQDCFYRFAKYFPFGPGWGTCEKLLLVAAPTPLAVNRQGPLRRDKCMNMHEITHMLVKVPNLRACPCLNDW
eukprot:g65994.t1